MFDGTIHPDSQIFTATLTQFEYMLSILDTKIPFLILINKQDLENYISADSYINMIELKKYSPYPSFMYFLKKSRNKFDLNIL